MELKEIKELLSTPTDLIKKIKEGKPDQSADISKQYDQETHAVKDTAKRKDKTVNKPTGEVNKDGKPELRASLESVNRITVSLQKLIVERASAFTTGVPIEITSTPETPQEIKLDAMVRLTVRDNKAAFKDSEICELMMKDTECAEIWYSEPTEKEYWGELGNGASTFKMRLKIVAPSKGDTLYPIFDGAGDMVSFGRGYMVKGNGKDVERFDLYTLDTIFKFVKGESDWTEEPPIKISYGKIPVVYYSQDKTEWSDVQGKIERLETLLSNHADTNDYNGSPIITASGAIEGFSAKGETGKVFELAEGAEMKYITWDQAPESIRMEIDNLIDFIYTETRTPNISFKDLKGLGAISGIALKLLFLDAHLKAKKKQNGPFGESIQRRLNFLKSAMAVINLEVKPATGMTMEPKFGLYMPDNETERIENMVQLVTSGIISKQTALELLNMVEDVEAEFELIKAENDQLGVVA